MGGRAPVARTRTWSGGCRRGREIGEEQLPCGVVCAVCRGEYRRATDRQVGGEKAKDGQVKPPHYFTCFPLCFPLGKSWKSPFCNSLPKSLRHVGSPGCRANTAQLCQLFSPRNTSRSSSCFSPSRASPRCVPHRRACERLPAAEPPSAAAVVPLRVRCALPDGLFALADAPALAHAPSALDSACCARARG